MLFYVLYKYICYITHNQPCQSRVKNYDLAAQNQKTSEAFSDVE